MRGEQKVPRYVLGLTIEVSDRHFRALTGATGEVIMDNTADSMPTYVVATIQPDLSFDVLLRIVPSFNSSSGKYVRVGARGH
jgi:hypothetical protein